MSQKNQKCLSPSSFRFFVCMNFDFLRFLWDLSVLLLRFLFLCVFLYYIFKMQKAQIEIKMANETEINI